MTGAALSRTALLRHGGYGGSDGSGGSAGSDGSAAATRLVCLPHAGAGAASFTRWLALFPPGIAVVRTQLPGREDLAAQPPFPRVRDAVDALLPQVVELGDAPVAIYGHSMGAVVGFELARALTAEGRPPAHLFVSGRRAPHLPARRATIHHLPDEEFLAALADMGGADGPVVRGRAFRRYTARLVRADLRLAEEHEHHAAPALPCPVTVFYGTEDPIVDLDQAEAWREHTGAAFAVHTFPGDHFFHQRHRVAIAGIMAEALG